MPKQILTVINSCAECPNSKRTLPKRSNHWHFGVFLTCDATKTHEGGSLIGWENDSPTIPSWCPLENAHPVQEDPYKGLESDFDDAPTEVDAIPAGDWAYWGLLPR